MLEPTKEPLKPISAAEKIASIGQTPPVSPEMNTCTSDQFQVKNRERRGRRGKERMRETMGCLASFFIFIMSTWCLQSQLEVLLLDLLFMCDWKGVRMIRLEQLVASI